MSLTDSSEKDGLDVHKANDYGTGSDNTAAVQEMEGTTEDDRDLTEEDVSNPAWMTKYCPWVLKYPWIKNHLVTKKSKKGELVRVARGTK